MSDSREAGGGDPLALAQRGMEAVSRVAVWIGGAAYVALCLLVAIDVVLRKVANVTVGGTDEISGYVLAITTAWGLAFTLLQRAHIRIDALYNRLPVRVCAALDLVALLGLGYVAVLMTWWGHVLLATSIAFGSTANTPLQTPLWIPQSLWWAGLVFFCLTLALLVVRATRALLRGDVGEVGRLAGVRTVEDEIDGELGGEPGGSLIHHRQEGVPC